MPDPRHGSGGPLVREAQNQVTARVLIWTAAVVAPGAAWGGHLGVQTARF